jgi:hypothetical protein
LLFQTLTWRNSHLQALNPPRDGVCLTKGKAMLLERMGCSL